MPIITGRLRAAAAVFLLVLPGAEARAQTPAAVTPVVEGAWLLTLDLPVGVATPSMRLTTKGDDLSGTYSGRYGDFPIAGLVKGPVVTFTFQMGTLDAPVTVCFTGEWVAETGTLKGTATLGALGTATWTAARDPKPVHQP